MIKLRRVLKDYEQSGAFHTNLAVLEAIDDNTFLTKAGYVFTVFHVDGIDDECLDSGQVDQIAQRVEAALRLIDGNFRMYQYFIKFLPSPSSSQNAEFRSFKKESPVGRHT